ncbi:MAG: helicase-related protein, partial [Pseudonocardiaceae bacterium]
MGLLRSRIDQLDEGFEADADYESAEDGAQDTAGRALRALSAEENALLDGLQGWAEGAAARPDSKAEALLDLIEATCRPDGDWGPDRIIVFTEYRATQQALLDFMAARGLTEGERTLLLYGGMPTDERTQIKAAFQAHPSESPVRILLATDSASEGINLQNHCHRLVHVEIPWNPNRLEQRNGRVDRHGQRADEVLIHHFAPSGYRSADTAGRPVGELDGDLEFLCRAVEKVQAIREMLGSVGPVIAGQVEEAMLGRRRGLDTRQAEVKGEAARQRVRFERQLEADLRDLQDSYDETRAEQRLTPEHIGGAVDVALQLAGQPALLPAGPGRWRLPVLTDA